MQSPWHQVASVMLRPVQPRLARCRARAAAVLEHDTWLAERRAKALAACRERIEAARSQVFETGTGVVGAHMTALEREWIALDRLPRSAAVRARTWWNELAPARWKDRMPCEGPADLATILALASDPDGVERAEAAALRLAVILQGWSVAVAAATSWRPDAAPGALFQDALVLPLQAARDAMATTYGATARAERGERAVASVRAAAQREPALSAWPALVEDLVLAARLDFWWQACAVEQRVVPTGLPHAGVAFADLGCPARPLRDLWSTGFFACALAPTGIVLGALPV